MLKAPRVVALLVAALLVESCALDFGGYHEGTRDGGTGGTDASAGPGGTSGTAGAGGASAGSGGTTAVDGGGSGGAGTAGSGGASGSAGSGGASGSAGSGGASGSGGSAGAGNKCNPLAPQIKDATHSACQPGYDCLPSQSGVTTCVPSGGGYEGSPCTASADCLPGVGCVNVGGGLRCEDYCLTDQDCTTQIAPLCDGTLSPQLYDGSTPLKYCTP